MKASLTFDGRLVLSGDTESSGISTFSGISTRGTRVVIMALLLAMLNVWDLWITIGVYQAGTLFEGNPLARYVLDAHGILGISLFKTVFVGIALWGFLLGRKLLLAEIGCVTTTCVYVVVAWRWTCYPSELLTP